MKVAIRSISLMLGALSVLLLTSCNTVEGAGKDIQKAGEAVQDAAD